jgi:hypothetical protein
VRRWNPRNAIVAVVVAAGMYLLEWLLGVDPTDALVDAIVVGFIGFAVLEYWRI